MDLFIQAQDIGYWYIGLSDHSIFVHLERIESSPEKYLWHVDDFLKRHRLEKSDLESVVVVTGPGSFTASRQSVMIANMIAFARDIPVYGVENSLYLEPAEVLENVDRSNSGNTSVTPFYDRPPLITKVIGDNLLEG